MPSGLATPQLSEQLKALRRLIGNTPLLAVHLRFRGHPFTLYAKSEQTNLTGSIKDRMALHTVERAYATGELHPGDTIAEATSGNTGIAFAALGRALGHPVRIFMPDWMSDERKHLLLSYGAELVPVSRADGGFPRCIERAEEFAAEHPHVFLPRQFSNHVNVEAHETTTGPEIAAQLEERDLTPQAFVAGLGTGGTVMGVGNFLRARYGSVRIHPIEPAESPTLSTGHKVGRHRIQGISDDFIPAIVELEKLDPVLAVSDGDSILMAQKLAAQLGLGVGISSGCNFIAALGVLEQLGPEAVVVTVFPDDNKKYLTTDLLREEPVLDGYLSPEVELAGLSTLPRACAFCERY
jgi:cysteine synthase A